MTNILYMSEFIISMNDILLVVCTRCIKDILILQSDFRIITKLYPTHVYYFLK